MSTVSKTRIEADSMGEIAVPSDRCWGAQTDTRPTPSSPFRPVSLQGSGARKCDILSLSSPLLSSR